jgi:ABC-2 type transport system ATP-binding protein
MSNNAIAVDSLTKRFGELTAVDGISFQVGEAEIFGFLGPNGAGKTTTISMLCTLLRPTSGRALIGGHDIAREAEAVRREIGIVFQDTTLDDRLTARENLVFHGELYGLDPHTIAGRASEMLDRVGLADRAGDTVITFSGGMKRRLEIARGLMHAPSVLFLDEPTLGLDPQTRRSLWSYAESLRDTEGVTIFMTTHYMDEAEACDRIAIIDQGRIVALDTPAGLKSGLGGDVVSVAGPDNLALVGEIRERFEVDPRIEGESIEFRVDRGEVFLPLLFSRLTTPVQTVSVRRPTLDDVFVSLTGHQIRASSADEADKMRSMARTGRGGFGPGGGRPPTGGRR